MAPDLDILIQSGTDPLVGLEYHRHFTHSLAFIPFGGLLVALPWLLRSRFAKDRRAILAATTVGYATHAVLDCCTSYGTLWLWPFSDERVAWSFMSIIDLLYTLPLLVGVWLSARSGSRRPVTIAFALAHTYLVACGAQKLRALALRDRLVEQRGHTVERSFVQNLLGTNIGWRSLYQYDGRIYADALYAPWFSEAVVREGTSTPVDSPNQLPEPVRADARTMRGFDVFRWFSSGWYTLRTDDRGTTICDVRYSVDPAAFAPFWCAELRPGADIPVVRIDASFDRSGRLGEILSESFSAPAGARPVE